MLVCFKHNSVVPLSKYINTCVYEIIFMIWLYCCLFYCCKDCFSYCLVLLYTKTVYYCFVLLYKTASFCTTVLHRPFLKCCFVSSVHHPSIDSSLIQTSQPNQNTLAKNQIAGPLFMLSPMVLLVWPRPTWPSTGPHRINLAWWKEEKPACLPACLASARTAEERRRRRRRSLLA